MKENKSEIIKFRLTPKQLGAVKKAMKQGDHKTVSRFIRSILGDRGII
jgi:hypothetical protein